MRNNFREKMQSMGVRVIESDTFDRILRMILGTVAIGTVGLYIYILIYGPIGETERRQEYITSCMRAMDASEDACTWMYDYNRRNK